MEGGRNSGLDLHRNDRPIKGFKAFIVKRCLELDGFSRGIDPFVRRNPKSAFPLPQNEPAEKVSKKLVKNHIPFDPFHLGIFLHSEREEPQPPELPRSHPAY